MSLCPFPLTMAVGAVMMTFILTTVNKMVVIVLERLNNVKFTPPNSKKMGNDDSWHRNYHYLCHRIEHLSSFSSCVLNISD